MERVRAAVPFRFYALVAILALAATLRLAELPFRGLIYWDEGKFLLEGVRLETSLRLLAGARDRGDVQRIAGCGADPDGGRREVRAARGVSLPRAG